MSEDKNLKYNKWEDILHKKMNTRKTIRALWRKKDLSAEINDLFSQNLEIEFRILRIKITILLNHRF